MEHSHTSATSTGFSSVQSSRSVMSNSLRPHGLQHVRLPCPSPTHGACSDSCPLSLWCHPTISPSVIPFSSRLQSFPASGFFLMSQFFINSYTTGMNPSQAKLANIKPHIARNENCQPEQHLSITLVYCTAKGLSHHFTWFSQPCKVGCAHFISFYNWGSTKLLSKVSQLKSDQAGSRKYFFWS